MGLAFTEMGKPGRGTPLGHTEFEQLIRYPHAMSGELLGGLLWSSGMRHMSDLHPHGDSI